MKINAPACLAGADPEILKRSGALSSATDEENFRFQMV